MSTLEKNLEGVEKNEEKKEEKKNEEKKKTRKATVKTGKFYFSIFWSKKKKKKRVVKIFNQFREGKVDILI
jgi:hypothetical protein